MPRYVQPFLIALACCVWAVALFERSDAPFVNAKFTHTLTRAAPLAPVAELNSIARGADPLVFSIDVVSEGNRHLTVAGKPSAVFFYDGSAPLTIDGWAVDPRAVAPAHAIVARIDDTPVAAVKMNRQRPDVAAAYQNAAYTNSGFHLTIAAPLPRSGRHRLTFIFIDADGDGSYFPRDGVELTYRRNGPS